MEKFSIEVIKGEEKLRFEVVDYPHSDEYKCKFEIYSDSKMVASFEPDHRGLLHICNNSGIIDEETLHLIADKIETMRLW
jgi:hypothetical protein